MYSQLKFQLTHDQLQDGVVWEGWGTSLAWFAVTLGGQEHLREAICSLLFSRNPSEGLGMNIVRYNIGGACQAHASDYRTGAAVPCFKQPEGSYEWSADNHQVAMLLSAAQHGVDTFEAFVNSPPWFWTKSGTSRYCMPVWHLKDGSTVAAWQPDAEHSRSRIITPVGSYAVSHWLTSFCIVDHACTLLYHTILTSRGHNLPLVTNLQQQHIGGFAEFCGDVIEHFAAVHNIQFSSLSPFNEPCSPAWCLKAGNRQEGCYISRSSTFRVLQALAQQPALKSHQVQLVAFEQFCLRDTLSDLNHLSAELWDIIQRINLHTYTSKHFLPSIVRPYLIWQDNTLWRYKVRKLAKRKQKKIWVSEFGSGRGALTLAKQVIKDIVQLKPTAWVYWQAVEAPGSHWGLLEVPLEIETETTVVGASPVAGTAPGSSEAPVCRGCISQPDQVAPVQITLHPNYLVLHFIMQCIPKGSSVFRVKQLGKFGLLVQHSAQHWVLLYLNSSESRVKRLSFDAAALDTRCVVTRGVAAMSTSIDSTSEGTSQPSSFGAQAEVDVRMLDIKALQPVAWNPGLVISRQQAVRQVDTMSKAWPVVIAVPKQNLCRVDMLLR